MEASPELARYTVLLDCETTARLDEGHAFDIKMMPSVATTNIDIRFSTFYEDVGMAAPLPRQLITEASVTGGTFADAIAESEQVVNVVTPLMTLACNVLVPEVQLKLAYETTEGATQRQFKQWFYDEPSPLLPLQLGRRLDPELMFLVIDHVMTHVEGERIHRASVQYQEALRAWLPQRELRAVMHLFMAVEALTKALLRHECEERSVDEVGLCAEWGIEKTKLDAEVRRRLIFHEDTECYRAVKSVSDGLEHGFLGFPELHGLAAKCRDAAGRHIRQSILEFLDHLPPEIHDRLMGSTYDRPITGHGVSRSITGLFTGDGDLAAPGNRHPYLEWARRVKAVSRRGAEYQLEIEESFPLRCGGGIQFTPTEHGASVPLPDASINVVRGSDD
jgi:hypothetical protein